jgi:hypothetical protein
MAPPTLSRELQQLGEGDASDHIGVVADEVLTVCSHTTVVLTDAAPTGAVKLPRARESAARAAPGDRPRR